MGKLPAGLEDSLMTFARKLSCECDDVAPRLAESTITYGQARSSGKPGAFPGCRCVWLQRQVVSQAWFASHTVLHPYCWNPSSLFPSGSCWMLSMCLCASDSAHTSFSTHSGWPIVIWPWTSHLISVYHKTQLLLGRNGLDWQLEIITHLLLLTQFLH